MSDYFFDVMTKEEMDRLQIQKFEILDWHFAESGHSIKIAYDNRFYGLWNFQNGYLYGSWEIRQFSGKRALTINEQVLSPMVSELYDWIQERIRQDINAFTNKEMDELLRKRRENRMIEELREFEEKYREQARRRADDYKRMIRDEEERARYS